MAAVVEAAGWLRMQARCGCRVVFADAGMLQVSVNCGYRHVATVGLTKPD